jgi:hypothetical protein
MNFNEFIQSGSETVIKFMIPLVATFCGAFYANYRQNLREHKKELDEQVTALNKALFTLLRQINVLVDIQQNVLDEFRENELKAFILPTLAINEYSDIKFDFNSLAFMLNQKFESIKGVNTIQDLLLEQERFEQTLNSIKFRTKHHIEIIDPKLSEYLAKNPSSTFEEGIKSLREADKIKSINYTNQVYMHIDETVKSSKETYIKLYEYSKKHFPNLKFLYVSL